MNRMSNLQRDRTRAARVGGRATVAQAYDVLLEWAKNLIRSRYCGQAKKNKAQVRVKAGSQPAA